MSAGTVTPTELTIADRTLSDVGRSDAVPVDDESIFEIVRNPIRREIILLLADEQCGVDPPQIGLPDLAEYLARLQTDDPTAVSGSYLNNAKSALYQHHLPILEDAGLVTIDRDDDDPDVAWIVQPAVDLKPVANAIRRVEALHARLEAHADAE